MSKPSDPVVAVETFLWSSPRAEAYLGPPGPRDRVDPRGYVVRAGNRTIYPLDDRSLLVRVTTRSGLVGWGETYGLVAAGATAELIRELAAPGVIGRCPHEAETLWEELYDLMRVRGYVGGFWLDALAAIDIALWDLRGKMTSLALHQLLGGARRREVPTYASGLPRSTLDERVALARDLAAKGAKGVKFAGVVSPDAIEVEARALREALGPNVGLMVDLHWMFDRGSASALAQRLEPLGLAFIEAPCATEDIEGWAWVGRQTSIPVAGGEEWRTVHDAAPRLRAGSVSIVQPEMGHTGVTQFVRIARLAEAWHLPVIPHATIGSGVFLTASLQVSTSLANVTGHEHQHSVQEGRGTLWRGACEHDGAAFRIGEGPGLGLEPTEALLATLVPI
ncbi:mandelate racemase/muconate lactonizing enzyme family protein [Brevundimonas bacteroides]|uniref:mandelate racemase/muconate lactonizing enzyme family protein n=1 Tax=Brevundimonas bacteroides TaxID=74311 RepID=UPI0004956460|nr:mandelate racemase/muconate lactonizing enzyme family protein [Brevundimonas bacteroides]